MNRPIYRPYTPLNQSNSKVNVNCNPFGCLLFCVVLFLLVFFLTHLSPIWEWLSRLVGA